MPPVSVPTTQSFTSSFTDYAVGAGGALIVGLSQQILGSGFIGSLIAPVLAASVIKGSRGQTLATISGFFGIASLLSGFGTDSNGNGSDDVM